MYLSRLELQGFKTFPKKTVLEFQPGDKNKETLTVIVGPNGSGKSNIADAIRWCLGEQSMKQLRGKKTEDIIFSGSSGKARSGFAEVSLTINNEDKAMKVDYAEVTITRRVYRDGDAEYLLNGKRVRLADIQLLLAEAGVGQRTYSVIGQGMIDHVLTSSPEERKIFFDDATGVRGLQIKRHQSMLKLKKASENLVDVELLLNEIEPRLRSLKRQVKRLEKREKVEAELKELQEKYYRTLWWNLQNDQERVDERRTGIHTKVVAKKNELKEGDRELLEMEQASSGDKKDVSGLQSAQKEYKAAQLALSQARSKHFEAQRELELAKVKAQSTWAPLPLSEIIGELDTILNNEKTSSIEKVVVMIKKLRSRLTKPNPADFKPDQKMLSAIEVAKKNITKAESAIKSIEEKIDELNKATASSKTELFTMQRKLREKQGELYKLEHQENEFNIELARIETRIESLTSEMKEEIASLLEQITKENTGEKISHTDDARGKILNLKHELELIGGIDEETILEFEETKQRHEFLSGQLADIRSAIKSTEKIIDELDENISKQSEKAFRKINTEFQKYFKILFGGGSCSLVKLKNDTESSPGNDTKVTLDRAMEELAEEKIEEDRNASSTIMKRVKKRQDAVAGIDIQATPPGKRLKSLNLLSGGERALTSIALLSAIMATNPSPFVVLDEVDAALDESNTVRFASILNELQQLTQFIVITHNRATMERADMLYGVTMGDDGMSNILSVSMTDVDEHGTVRR
jgi:chromosome segregation ATPase